MVLNMIRPRRRYFSWYERLLWQAISWGLPPVQQKKQWRQRSTDRNRFLCAKKRYKFAG
jgi:hypothetical protein